MKRVLVLVGILACSISVVILGSEDSDQQDVKKAFGKALTDQVKYRVGRGMEAMTKEDWEVIKETEDLEPLFDRIEENTSGSGVLIGVGTYVATDFAVKKTIVWAGSHESVRNVVKKVPKQHRLFIYNTGKEMVSSTMSRSVMTFVEKGKIDYDDARKIGVNALNIGVENTISTYVAKPAVDRFFGPEDSAIKHVSQFIIGGAVVQIINKTGRIIF